MTRRLVTVIIGLASLAIISAIGGIVYAQGDAALADKPNAVEQLTEMAFQILTPVVTLFVMWAAHRAIAAFERKVGIQVPASQEQAIDGWIAQGILLAEEKSRSAIKKQAKKLSGPEKLETAGDFVLGMVKARGWDRWAAEAIKDKIESKLGHHRANGGKPRLDVEGALDLPDSA